MRPRERLDSGQADLFRARLDQIVDINHPLTKLGADGLRDRQDRQWPSQQPARRLLPSAYAEKPENKPVA